MKTCAALACLALVCALGPALEGKVVSYQSDGGAPSFREWPVAPVVAPYAERDSVGNVQISVAGGNVFLTWDAMPTAESYKVYSSDNPLAGFSEDLTGTFTRQGWYAPVTWPRRFYYITAVITPPLPPNMILVNGGTFHNGYSNITLTTFCIDKYEVTQSSYQTVMGTNPAVGTGLGVGPNYPVYVVSWFNAFEYCNRRSLTEGYTPCYSYSTYGTDPDNWPAGWDGNYLNTYNMACDFSANGYRLPTEMEWVYAAKGGHLTPPTGYNAYAGCMNPAQLANYAWYAVNNTPFGPKLVGQLLPNELGIHDMSGNVQELVWDMYWALPGVDLTDPTGGTASDYRIYKGGSFQSIATNCAIAQRSWFYANGTNIEVGFRVCKRLP